MTTLVTRSRTIYYSNVSIQDIDKDNNTYNIGSDKYFNFGFSLVVNGTDLIANGTYVDVSLDQVTQSRSTSSNSSTITTTYKSIPYSKWGTAFDSIDKSKATQLGLSDYYWPSSTDYSIKGSDNSDEYIYIQLNIKFWTARIWMANQKLIDLTNAKVQMVIVNSFVDFNDYNYQLRFKIIII